MTTTQAHRLTLAAMYVGLVLTVVQTVAPYVDRAASHELADHIRAGYPAYNQDRIDSAVTTWLVLLSVVGVLGIGGWTLAIWAVRTQRRWSRWGATAMCGIGVCVALAALLTKDTSGEVGLAPVLGWLGMLPCAAGLAAVAMLWTRPGRLVARDA
jgi:hypothetical protein